MYGMTMSIEEIVGYMDCSRRQAEAIQSGYEEYVDRSFPLSHDSEAAWIKTAWLLKAATELQLSGPTEAFYYYLEKHSAA